MKKYKIPFSKTVHGYFEVESEKDDPKDIDLGDANEFENKSDYDCDWENVEVI
ncbi:hypothetical protein D1BOALGB6SA_10295 [Olavius sp. associated proteobacterium Delta 1]|nr:hypothetical protein D1BOALGB6SA_10295 [Olavius sp. associated proteobacterium Delta 1]